MSQIRLATIKELLQVIHDKDDAALQTALDGAEREACAIMNKQYLPTVHDPIFPIDSEIVSEVDPVSESETVSEVSDEVEKDVLLAVYILTKAIYDETNPSAARSRAETLLSPYRVGLGI